MAQFDQIDTETVAALLGVSARQVNNYINLKGLPSQGEGRRRTFVWADVLAWYVDYRTQLEMGTGNGGNDDGEMEVTGPDAGPQKPENLPAAMLRKTIAEANLKDLALARMRGEMIGIVDARIRVERAFGNLRTALLGMAPKLSTRLAGVKDPVEIEAIIKDEMEMLCRELSTGAIVGIQDEASSDTLTEVTAAAEEDGLTEEQIEQLTNELVEIYAAIQL